MAHVAFNHPMDCPLLVWLQAQADRDDPLAIRRDLVALPASGQLGDAIWTAHDSFNALIGNASRDGDTTDKAAVQAIYAGHIAAIGDFTKLRGRAERLFRDQGAILEPETWAILIPWFAQGHPNPKAFLAMPAIRAGIPATQDLTALPCPQFPELDGVALWGGRGV